MRISKEPSVRRREIIETARDLFETQGTARTAIADIAERAGIAKGLVYYYFASRENLLAAVVDQLAETVDRELTDSVDRSGLDFPGKLTAILQVFFGVISRHPHLLDPTQSEPVVRGLVFDRLLAMALKHCGAVLKQGLQDGLVQLAYPDETLKILVNGLGSLYVEGCTDPRVHATIAEQVLCLAPGSLRFPGPSMPEAQQGTASPAAPEASAMDGSPSARESGSSGTAGR